MMLFGDSWGHYSTAQLGRKWDGVYGDVAVTPGAGRNFGQGFQVLASGGYLFKSFPVQSAIVVGFALKLADLGTGDSGTLVRFLDSGAEQVSLQVNHNGTLSLAKGGVALIGGTSPFVLVPGTYAYVEVKLTIAPSVSANSCKVRVDEADWITLSAGSSTCSTANSSVNGLHLGEPGASSIGVRTYADFYLLSPAGPHNNDFLGNVMYGVLLPVNTGDTFFWTPGVEPINYQNVRERLVNDDANYVYAGDVSIFPGGIGVFDSYTMSNLPGTPARVFAIQWNGQFRKADEAFYVVKSLIRGAGHLTYGSSSHTPVRTYSNYCDVFETNPYTGLPWTPENVNLDVLPGMVLYSRS